MATTRSRRRKPAAQYTGPTPRTVRVTLPPAGAISLGLWALRTGVSAWLRRKPLVSLALSGFAADE